MSEGNRFSLSKPCQIFENYHEYWLQWIANDTIFQIQIYGKKEEIEIGREEIKEEAASMIVEKRGLAGAAKAR